MNKRAGRSSGNCILRVKLCHGIDFIDVEVWKKI